MFLSLSVFLFSVVKHKPNQGCVCLNQLPYQLLKRKEKNKREKEGKQDREKEGLVPIPIDQSDKKLNFS